MKSAIEAAVGRSVSRETIDRMEAYFELLQKWNPAINLVSKSTLKTSPERHFADSAQLEPLSDADRSWVDLGTGGGFPGLLVACLRAETCPDFRMTLVESDQRKAAFLRTVAIELSLSVDVIAARAEELSGLTFQTVSARALAPLSTLARLADPLLEKQGCCLFPKGVSYAREVDETRKEWHFNLETIKSITNPDSVILKLKGLHRA